jgi:hypothetical protein
MKHPTRLSTILALLWLASMFAVAYFGGLLAAGIAVFGSLALAAAEKPEQAGPTIVRDRRWN